MHNKVSSATLAMYQNNCEKCSYTMANGKFEFLFPNYRRIFVSIQTEM